MFLADKLSMNTFKYALRCSTYLFPQKLYSNYNVLSCVTMEALLRTNDFKNKWQVKQ